MAWDEISFHGRSGISGDDPIDEVALALQRIAAHYQKRFSRLPTLTEVLYALDVVLDTQRGRLFTDDHAPLQVANLLRHGGIAPNPPIAFGDFEGCFVDSPPPGHHVIEKKASVMPAAEIIHAKLSLEGRTLHVAYRILSDGMTEDVARSLIQKVLLDEFCDHYYDSLTDRIDYQRL